MKTSKLRPIASASVSLILLGIAFWRLSGVDWDQALTAAQGVERNDLLAASIFIVLSFFVYSFYDVLALRWLGKRLTFLTVFRVSFISTCVSMNVGFSVLSGSAMRLALYPKYGLGLKDISLAYVKMAFLFASGWAIVCGVSCIWLNRYFSDQLGIPMAVFTWVGWGSVLASALYFLWCWKFDEVRIGRFRISIPSLRLALTNTVVAIVDIGTSVAVFHILVPGESLIASVARFIAGNVVAIASQIPGGLGVFEWTAVELSGTSNEGLTLGGLLVFRLLYFWVPLIFALVLWGVCKKQEAE